MYCVSIGEKTTENCINQIKMAEQCGAGIIEIRLDYLREKEKLVGIISSSDIPTIATCRNGSQKILIKAIDAGAKYIDMDIKEIDNEVLFHARQKKCGVILSYHNFQKTPSLQSLISVVDILKNSGADIVKIVAWANCEEDNRVILSLYEETDYPLIAFNMGEVGKTTRIGCLIKGALWTYCSLGKNRTAAGQMDLSEMKKIKKYAVIGNPIKHSMSPAMHNANFKSLKINARYVSAQVRDLKKYMETVVSRDIAGVNITIPHKIEVMKYMDKIDPLAEKIGAINTVHNNNGKLIGYNTDAYGALRAIKEKIKSVKNNKVVLLGAGGAARAVYFILKQEKAEIIILAKNIEKAGQFGEAQELNDENIKKYVAWADVLINCTPVGMNSNESLVKKEYFKKDLIVFDIVYTPLKTRMIKESEEAGCKTILGYKMLVFQGVKAFEIWTGKKANIRVMLENVKNQLLPNIALIGFMGSGKTTVGKMLAEDLKRGYIEIDKEIEDKEKMTITDIFAKYGEKYFRNLESKMLAKISQNKNSVISCGGGIVSSEKSREILKSFIVIFLNAEPETIMKRLSKNTEKLINESQRPLLRGLNKREKIGKIRMLLEERKVFYENCTDYTINTDKYSQKEVVERIEKIIDC